jgi:hypothetical protein
MIKLISLVPYSLVVTRAGSLFGVPGRSWSLPIYMLNGRSINPAELGNEDPVPQLNVSPHPYTLPFLNEMQQHHLDVQIWQQQNAANPWEEAMPPPLEHNMGWDAWPEIVPEFRGTSLRSLTGYEGASMMDGVVPEHNESDDPATWSPVSESEEELSDIEAAADRLMIGQAGGSLIFARVGEIQIAEVNGESVQNMHVAGNAMIPSGTENSENTVASSVYIQRELDMFRALFAFLRKKIYCYMPAMIEGKTEKVSLGSDDLVVFSADTLAQCLFFAVLHQLVYSVALLDSAEMLAIKNVLSPTKISSAEYLGYFQLDLSGNLVWMEAHVSSQSFSGLGSTASGSSFSDSTEEEISSLNLLAPVPRTRGRPRKTATPKVVTEVKRCTRNNKEGYIQQSLPDGPSQRKKSKVKKAVVPEVLQISEMQRLGVEHCQIPPEELTEARLRQVRSE